MLDQEDWKGGAVEVLDEQLGDVVRINQLFILSQPSVAKNPQVKPGNQCGLKVGIYRID